MMLIKKNGKYGAMVGNIHVFTTEGAIKAYKLCVETCYNNLSLESCLFLSKIEDDMHKIGFSFDELEAIELSIIPA